MKKLLLLITLLLISPTWAIKTVIVDAGHGGKDKGGSWGKVYEKHLALDTAFRLERYLKKKGYRVIMTRSRDEYLTLAKRVSIGNKYKNAIFVSIHANKASRSGAAGIETFYYGSEGRKLGQAVQDKMISKVKAKDRGNKYGSYYVLRKSKIPAILAEIGFVSNRTERERMKSGYYRDAVAKAIADGISKYDRGYIPLL